MKKRWQNSGVVVIATITEYYDDCDLVVMENDYFNVLQEIRELGYLQNNHPVMFKCF